jgi:signal transduction histidine kinase
METESGAAALIPLGEFLTTEEPVWVWDASARRILWANQAGRAFWGADSLDTLRAKRFSSRGKSVARLTALASQPGRAREWVETLTLAAASGRRPVKCHLQGLEVAGGRPGLIVKALGQANGRDPQPAASKGQAPDAARRRERPTKTDRAALDAIAARLGVSDRPPSRSAPIPAPERPATDPDSIDHEMLELGVNELCHEMRNPLQVIQGFAERIIEIAPSGRRQVQLRGYAGDIIEGANLAMAVLGDFSARMLRLSDAQPQPEPVALRPVLESCVRLIAPLAKTAGIKLYRRIDGRLPPLLTSERVLKQILLNLIMNALRHHKTGGWIKVSARHRRDGSIRLAVADDGKGMSKKEIKAALSGARQVTPPGPGRSGLGLPLVKRLAEGAGGKLAIESGRGKGTTVEILFPAAS